MAKISVCGEPLWTPLVHAVGPMTRPASRMSDLYIDDIIRQKDGDRSDH